MRRLRAALAIFASGVATALFVVWLNAYFRPQVITPSADAIARSVLEILRPAYRLYFGEEAKADGANLSPKVLICVERSARTSHQYGGWEPVKFLFYFRALAKWWDPRGLFLDLSATGSFFRKLQVSYAHEGWYSLGGLKAAVEHQLQREKITGVGFYEDCLNAPQENGRLRIVLVGVSPQIPNPYGLAWYVDSALGFFAAFEVTDPKGGLQRFVIYTPTHVLESKCPFRTDPLLPTSQLIPSSFWEEEFRAWPDLPAAARQRESQICPY